MLRIVLAVIIGYLAIALSVFIGLTTAYMSLGPEGVFQPSVFDLTTTWVVAAVGVNLVAAIVGGIVCALIARRKSAPLIFAAIVFLLGVGFAIPTIASYDAESPARPEGITMFEAMRDGRQPAWFAFSNPFVVAVGIMLGGALVGSRNKPHA